MSITITITDPGSVPLHEMERICEYLERAARAGSQPAIIPPAPPAPFTGEALRMPQEFGTTNLPPVDSRGYPWDARIHSDSKSKNANGTWRYRRGVKEDVIEPVEAELRGVMGVGTALPVAPEPAMEPVVEPQGAAMQQVSVPVIEPVVVPPPPPAPDASGDDFNHLANIATKALAAKTITQAQVSEILNAVGEANGCVLPHLGALFTRKDLIPAVRAKLQALIAAGGAQ